MNNVIQNHHIFLTQSIKAFALPESITNAIVSLVVHQYITLDAYLY